MEMPHRAVLDDSLPFRRIREQTETLCAHLTAEDCNLQAIAETSPLKWHLAHVTWFFETFILLPFGPGYKPYNDSFQVLFNSYYNGIGQQHPRPRRHLLSRPALDEVYSYRHHVDRHLLALLEHRRHPAHPEVLRRLELGLNHEQQHQELMLTDLKYNFSCNPLLPHYLDDASIAGMHPGYAADGDCPDPLEYEEFAGGLVEIGRDGGASFGFDNEGPRHKVWLEPFRLARRLVNNGDFRAFIADGGYQRPELWLSDGWSTLQQTRWRHPLYWQEKDDHSLSTFTLYGLQDLVDSDPVTHLSYYEADAFARWHGARLPTEQEWEHACTSADTSVDRIYGNRLHPTGTAPGHPGRRGLRDLFGQVWQWTSSTYQAYPGYRPAAGALGEYNGKFMCNQFVLRGSSCVTPERHSRSTYRNFFYPADRWQFTGLRLATDGQSPQPSTRM